MGAKVRSATAALSRSRVRPIRKWFGLSQANFARVLGVSRATVQRWEPQNAGPDPNTAEGRILATMVESRDLATRMITPTQFKQWLQARAPSFVGKTPLEILIERGPVLVRDLLMEAWEGNY